MMVIIKSDYAPVNSRPCARGITAGAEFQRLDFQGIRAIVFIGFMTGLQTKGNRALPESHVKP
ncbi:hypothetical protein D1AOALGA4SA_3241 [Olavius algarvensis Delta 1 endosymbiont]|nr:hypothetical protein D1AOALGA4SA_3241 [Olavius algarvensis Delta 1 endosymbiont]